MQNTAGACFLKRVFRMSENLYFDQSDRDLLAMVNSTTETQPDEKLEQKLFNTALHPHGIISLASSHEIRVAHAVINLLYSIEGQRDAAARLAALRALYDEVINSASTPFRINTGRVLVQMMKDIIRAKGNDLEQLKLIHDFRKVAAGNPRIVRSFLASRYLIEMPESWDQLTMDQHVHDSNTKGRKNPTYLIMDAWVKGIRSLTVIYHNTINPAAVEELTTAAEIMKIRVRVGLEFRSVFRDKYVDFIWAPRGFAKYEDAVNFFKSEPVRAVLEEGEKANVWYSNQTYALLESFNKHHLQTIAERFGIAHLNPIDKDAFTEFVGKGRASRLHLSDFIHKCLIGPMAERVKALQTALPSLNEEERKNAKMQIADMDSLTSNKILSDYLSAKKNPEVPNRDVPANDGRPAFLSMPVIEHLKLITSLRSGFRTTLQLSGLTAADVLEILWDAQGLFTHLERINVKEYFDGEVQDLTRIGKLQNEINEAQIISLKATIMELIAENKDDKERAAKLTDILNHISDLIALYEVTPLGSTFGTDSTGHVGNRFGMGLAVVETLPSSAQKKLCANTKLLPVTVKCEVQDTYSDEGDPGVVTKFLRKLRNNLAIGMDRKRDYTVRERTVEGAEKGNIATLGGMTDVTSNGLLEVKPEPSKKIGAKYLTTPVLNIIKVLIGLVPAFCTFMVTQNWWFLACFGAFIWLGITGFRNIIQMLIASGSFFGGRIKWHRTVQWTRLCESLMYTGWSVVLLEGLMRNAILVGLLNIKVTEHPLLVFTVIALANGTYISSHNIFRGFPMTAVVGNFFRSVLAIPVALVYNVVLAAILPFVTDMPVSDVLIYSSAIITKLASDTIALIIEATADRRNFYRLRNLDYDAKFKAIFACYVKLETLFPELNMLEVLAKPGEFQKVAKDKGATLREEIFAHLMDLMFFWFYRNSSHQVFKARIKAMTPVEREILSALHMTFFTSSPANAKEIIEEFLGDRSAKCLAFYEENFLAYFKAMRRFFPKLVLKLPSGTSEI